MTRLGPPTEKMASNLRLSISNDAGYSLNMWIYKEETDPVTGILKFATVGPQNPLSDKAQKPSVDQVWPPTVFFVFVLS